MRISEWSSDVCSSDLGQIVVAVDAQRRDAEPVSARGEGAGPTSRDALEGRNRPLVVDDVQHDRRLVGDRKSVVSGKSVSVRVDLGGRRIIKKKTLGGEGYEKHYKRIKKLE